MKFRFVLLGPDDGDGPPPKATGTRVESSTSPDAPWYEIRGQEILRRQPSTKGGGEPIAVANFTARIVRDLIRDDGEEEGRAFELEAELAGRRLVFTVPAAEFGRMTWVLQKLGPQAIIYPGQQQHARAAIQSLSGQIRQERIFTHLGWRKQGAKWVYLHAGGAVGAGESVDVSGVQLPAPLQQYQLRLPQDGGELVRAIRASLRILALAPDRITFPLLAGVYRAALGGVDFSLFLAGESGVFKSAIAALCQQHYGPSMDGSHLPANFASTGNALECVAFHAKDSLLVVDDFVAAARGSDRELQSMAERLFRAAGNGQGRTRLGGNARLRAAKPPRALVLGTGEEIPQGHSIRARLLIVEVGPGEVNRDPLSECQRWGETGLLATAMTGFVSWVASRYEETQRCLHNRALELRGQMVGRSPHARTPCALAELHSGWEVFLRFAGDADALSPVEREGLAQRSWRALEDLAMRQTKYQASSDPARRFVDWLQAALAGGKAHVADRQGKVPANAEAWGWERTESGGRWVQRGVRIGWVVGEDLYLEPKVSLRVAQEVAGTEGTAISEQALRQRLRERGYLASTDIGRQMLTVRRTLHGRPRLVLHFKSDQLVVQAVGSVDRSTRG